MFISYSVYHRLMSDARKMSMSKKIFIISLFVSFLYGCEKRWIERDDEIAPSAKRRCFMEIEDVRDDSWEAGFVKGVLNGWRMLEVSTLPGCGCHIAPQCVSHQLFTILFQCYVEMVDRDYQKIISSLFDYLRNHYILICDEGYISENSITVMTSWLYLKDNSLIVDALNKGALTETRIKLIASFIKMQLESYNSFMVMLNLQHDHRSLIEAPSYFS